MLVLALNRYTCTIAEVSGSVCVETSTGGGSTGGRSTSPLVLGRVTDADVSGTDNSALSFALVGNGGYVLIASTALCL